MMAAVFAVIIGGAVIGSSVHALKKPEVGAEMRNPGSKPAPIVPGNPSNPGNSGFGKFAPHFSKSGSSSLML